MVVRGRRVVEGDDLALTPPRHVVFLREFLLGMLAAKGGEARIEELVAALRDAPRHGIIVTGGTRELFSEIELLSEVGLLERRDGTVTLRHDKMPQSFKRKIEKVARLVAAVA